MKPCPRPRTGQRQPKDAPNQASQTSAQANSERPGPTVKSAKTLPSQGRFNFNIPACRLKTRRCQSSPALAPHGSRFPCRG